VLTCKIRRLAANGVDLCIQLHRQELATQQLAEGTAICIDLGGLAQVRGVVRTKGSTCWLGPSSADSNKATTSVLRSIGLEHGGEIRVSIADRQPPAGGQP
jgi:hypothetical protein